MIFGEEIIKKAREHVGTPYVHQGRLKNVGVDCVGLVASTMEELGLKVEYPQNYSRIPDPTFLVSTMKKYMYEIEEKDLLPGDVLLMRFINEPQHLGFFSTIAGNPYIIHSYVNAGRVVEHTYDKIWQKRTVGFFRIRS